MREFAQMSDLEVWYAKLTLDTAAIRARWGRAARSTDLQAFQDRVAQARPRDHEQAFIKLTHRVEHHIRIVSDPPLIVPLEELGETERDWLEGTLRPYTRTYGRSLPSDRRHLIQGYRFVHAARKVVGVGSVGTRCWIVLLLGCHERDPLFLQIKE